MDFHRTLILRGNAIPKKIQLPSVDVVVNLRYFPEATKRNPRARDPLTVQSFYQQAVNCEREERVHNRKLESIYMNCSAEMLVHQEKDWVFRNWLEPQRELGSFAQHIGALLSQFRHTHSTIFRICLLSWHE
ncbi:hypothetical protein PGT21_022129 [Puccinia graminis f. sp. tritici]|uniref:Uncharacterized protein n=1 Tax=Puccinia graminis f. sp. tritici TaxID=56615 RepID=A0A5B0M6L7_PUCGR|nr:hypothetical protein PGTUg99_011610 [Puccinia graminis f. sp. tritici]KAA1071889.1 hypothetical protein PGT21_022129 [Puccinia graminis f. sp. tritici]